MSPETSTVHARPDAVFGFKHTARLDRRMRVLVVKTSSLGDVIHTLPALTDAAKAIPNLSFDWVVEQPFAEIPGWHSKVKKIIPLAWRRWRKNIFSKEHYQEEKAFL